MTDKIHELETDAAVFKFLAAFYSVNPSEDIVKAAAELSAVMEAGELKECISRLQQNEDILELKRDWTKLFRGVSPEYSPMPPYEQLYGGDELLTLLKELAKYYLEAGFDCGGERHDYIGTELAFLSFLAEEGAKALREGDQASAERRMAMFEDFYRKHPGRWFSAFRKKASPFAATDFYCGAMELTEFALTS